MTGAADAILARADELLAPAGRLALDWSRELCRAVDHSGHDCAGYHAIWPYILRFGLAVGPQRQRDFFAAALRDAGPRVLISGAADYNLPATALWAYAKAGIVPDMTLTDVCETPLRLSGWFAEQIGAPIATIAGDILDYRPDTRYDTIVVHSFIGHFAPDKWSRLFAAWHDLLVPGGRVVMVHRVRPEAPDLIRFSPAQAEDFRAQFLAAAAARRDETGIPAEMFPHLIDEYVAHSVMFPLRSRETLTALFEGAGFRIDAVHLDPIDPARPKTSPGPTLAGGVEYIKLVASRQ